MASLAVPSSSRIGPAIPPPSNSGRRALDAELIRRTLSGDDAAARELHRHYRPIVASFLRKLGTQPHELEDTCQDVFTLFFRYLASFRGEAELLLVPLFLQMNLVIIIIPLLLRQILYPIIFLNA